MDPSDLIGTWRFDRAIQDRADDADYRAVGDATFTLAADGRIRWHERGVLSWAGGRTPVERTLFLCRADAAGHPSPAADRRWIVTFDDGREFHEWIAGDVAHWCSPDSYAGEISEPGEATDAWTLTWTVTGPHKDYTMTTSYRRAFTG